jgi:hypothetical protein
VIDAARAGVEMRREVTAISVFSTAIAFAAGVVLCMQLSQLGLNLGEEVAPPVLWGIEAAALGTAVYAWERRVTVVGWVLGIAGLVMARLAITSAAAVTMAVMEGAGDVTTAMGEMGTVTPRACAVVFGLMAFYPLRSVLPVRRERPRDQRRFAESAAVRSAEAAPGSGDRGLLIVTVKDRGKEREMPPEPRPAAASIAAAPLVQVEGTVKLPLREVLTRMPAGVVTEKGRRVEESETMEIPLGPIHPQLKEAQVVFTVAELRQWLPPAGRKAVLSPPDSDVGKETEQVVLPLELIVPQVPAEALTLAAATPPEWAKVEGTDPIVFAITE